MIRPVKTVLLLAVALLLAAGCAKPTQPPPTGENALLVGLWEQFVPVGSMPVEIELISSGDAAADGSSGRWRVEDDKLFIGQGGSEEAYSFTVSGYMLTLYNAATETSCFYINPKLFAEGADGNGSLAGQWAAWSAWGKLDFDGKSELNNIMYTTAGPTEVRQQYAARDGILQTVDTAGNYTYNLYRLEESGVLQLAETTDYDNDVKQWTAYWKKAAPGEGFTGQWKLVIDENKEDGSLPVALRLEANGSGSATVAGGASSGILWEDFGDFILIQYSQTNMVYAWRAVQGGVMYLGNPDADEGWYIDESRYQPTKEALVALAGTWKTEDGSASLEITADGSMTVRDGAGEAQSVAVTTSDGMMRLTAGSKTYYMAYGLDGDSLKLYYSQLPFLEQRELPVGLERAHSGQ